MGTLETPWPICRIRRWPERWIPTACSRRAENRGSLGHQGAKGPHLRRL